MLRKRVIPCLDVTAGRVVKGVQFVDLTDEGDPIELAQKYAEGGADEICFLDITASSDGRDTMLDVVGRAAARNVFVPLTVGGGVRTVADMRATLRAGADKVTINSAALADPSLIDRCAAAFGRQCVVLAIDAKQADSGWEVYSHGGRTPTGRDAVAWAAEGARRGAGELLVTSMDRDGTYGGYDLDLLRAIRAAAKVPVIASGGAGSVDDCVAAFDEAGADAVLAASIFHRDEITVATLKSGLAAAGVAVRQ